MQISNNRANNVNFQAYLDISRVKGSKNRWQNIAKEFERITSAKPDAELYLKGSFSRGLNYTMEDRLGCFEEFASNKLKQMPDIAVAEKLKKILKISIFQEMMAKAGIATIEKQPLEKRDLLIDGLVCVIDDISQKMLKNDRFFNMIDKKGNRAVDYTFY
jgi:hypothetical protein